MEELIMANQGFISSGCGFIESAFCVDKIEFEEGENRGFIV
jgi:hypothetical protein